jgi:hypothetical protein
LFFFLFPFSFLSFFLFFAFSLFVGQLRVDMDSKQKEFEETMEQRDATISQISLRAGRGGENARKAIEDLQTKLEQQDMTIADSRAEMHRLNIQLEAQAAVLNMTHQQHQVVLANFNQLLRDKTAVIELERSTRDRTIRELEAKIKSLTVSSQQEQSTLQHQVGRPAGETKNRRRRKVRYFVSFLYSLFF